MSQARVMLGLVLATLLLATPAWAEEAAPPGPEATVNKLLGMHFTPYGPLPGVRALNWQELFAAGADMNTFYQYQRFLQGFSYFVTAPPQPALIEGDTARVQVQAQPLELVLKRQGEKWLLDVNATLAALPPSMRNAVQAQLCSSALLRLAQAARQYAEKHEGKMPPAETWREELTPLLGGAEALRGLRCPHAPAGVVGYAMNQALGGRVLKNLARPDSTVLFFESDAPGANPAGGPDLVAAPRHDGLGLYVMTNLQLRAVAEVPSFDATEKTPPPVSAAGPAPPDGGG